MTITPDEFWAATTATEREIILNNILNNWPTTIYYPIVGRHESLKPAQDADQCARITGSSVLNCGDKQCRRRVLGQWREPCETASETDCEPEVTEPEPTAVKVNHEVAREALHLAVDWTKAGPRGFDFNEVVRVAAAFYTFLTKEN